MKHTTKKGRWLALQRHAREGWEYIKESKAYIGWAALFFCVCIFIGFVFAGSLNFLNTIITEMQQDVAGLHGGSLSLAIFSSNARSAFLSLFLGILLGIFSIVNIILNGTLIGYVIHALWIRSGSTHLWKLLPHGIFELPALFISWGLGIKLGMFIFTKNERKELKRRFFRSIKAFLFIVIPLLFVAAIIEGALITFFT